MDEQALWKIEEGFWTKGQAHFAANLHPDCLFALPEPSGLIGGKGFVDYLPEEGAFSSVEMSEQACSKPSENVRVLVYKAKGDLRAGGTRSALCSTTFVIQNGTPLLIQHQQTPL